MSIIYKNINMIKVFKSFLHARYSIAGIFILALLLGACKKNDSPNNRTPVASVMAFNLSTDKEAVGISLSGNNLYSVPLGYTNYTGVYLPVFTGNRQVKSFSIYGSSVLSTNNQIFQDSTYYSIFVVGRNGAYRNVIVNDSLNNLSVTPGQAFVRYINAIPDSTISPLVTISSNGATIINNNTAFGTVIPFIKVNAGDLSIAVNNGDSVAVSRTISVEQSKAYTILLTGIPHAVDTAKSIKIKFISNGTITK